MVLSLLGGLLGGGNTSGSNASSHANHSSGTSSTNVATTLPQYSFSSYGAMPSYSMPMLGGLSGNMSNLAGSYISGMGMPSYSGFSTLPSYTVSYAPSYMGMGNMTGMMGMTGMGNMTGMTGMTGMEHSGHSVDTTSQGPLTGVTAPFMGMIEGISDTLRGSGLGQILGIPLGLFSYAVGHDGALQAAQNGDIAGWMVNTQDHSSHSHLLGGADHIGSTAPLGFLGTAGQEIGYMLGLDQMFGNAAAYDQRNGTNYTGTSGTPTHLLPVWGGSNSSSSGSSSGLGRLLGNLLNII